MVGYSEIFTIKIEPNPDKGIPIEMFGDFLAVHQQILKIVVKTEDKKATVPQIKVVDVQHGSIKIEAFLDFSQKLMPFVSPWVAKMGEQIQNAFSGSETIEATKTNKIKIPKAVMAKMSQPMIDDMVLSVCTYGDDPQKPYYSLTKDDVQAAVLLANPIEDKDNTMPEPGEPMECTGYLRKVDWDMHSCSFMTDIDGTQRTIPCRVNDEAFLQGSVKENMHVHLHATPMFQTNKLGERSLKILIIDSVEVL